jgi:VWFA-related protein
MTPFIRYSPIWLGFFAGVLFTPSLMVAQSPQGASQKPHSESAAAAASQFELKLPVPLVIEDVVVLNSKGKPVRGLKPTDFIVAENGKRVSIRSFEEHAPSQVPADSAITPEKPPELGANVFTNIPQVPSSGSLTILLLDALNTPLGDQLFVRQQMLKFAQNLAPGAHVAIFGLGAHLSMLQGFTTDPAVLRAALEQKRGQPQPSPLRNEQSRGGPTDLLNDAVSDWLLVNKPSLGMDIRGTHMQTMAHEATFKLRQRVIFTLQSMNQLARYLSVLPGHKNLIWFSTAFPLNLTPNDMLADPYREIADFREAVRATADLLARSRVAVYPVDARGIFEDPAAKVVNRWLEVHDARVADQLSKHLEADQAYAEHDTMEQVATATGGQAFFNTNDLRGVVDEVINYGENYYTLTYSPPTQKFDGKYRKISVWPGDPNLHVYYRAGYFADDPNAPASGKMELPLNAMQTAMLHGVPDAIQVRFDAAIIPGEKPTEILAPGGHPDPRLMKPPYMSYTIEYIVDIRSVQFTVDEKKVHHGALELASFVYDHDGNPLNSTVSKVNIDLADDRFSQVAQKGVLTRQTVDAPAKGEHYLRIGIHDLSNDHVGAIEVPVANIKSLQELRAKAAKQDSLPSN